MPNISDDEWQRMKNAVDELTALNQIASAINVSMEVEKITQIAVDHCLRRINAAQGAVFLLGTAGANPDAFTTFVRETNSTTETLPFHLNMALTGWMVKHKTILLSNNPDRDENLRGVNFAQLGIQSILAAPLMSRSGLIGLMAVINKKDPGGFTDQDKRFLGIVGVQTAKVIENARLHENDLKLRDLQKEIALAQEIQSGFLPKTSVVTPKFEAFGFNEPAKGVGGDFYDMQQISENQLFVSLGDVAGKGIPASLLMANAQAVIRSQLSTEGWRSLPLLSESLNRLICQFTNPSQYLTMIMGFYDAPAAKLTYVNAGHLPLIVARTDGTVTTYSESDVVIGILPDMSFEAHDVPISRGDVALLYTDGVSECFDPSGQQFGIERVEGLLGTCAGQSAQEIGERILLDITEHRGAAEVSDDITLLVAKFY